MTNVANQVPTIKTFTEIRLEAEIERLKSCLSEAKEDCEIEKTLKLNYQSIMLYTGMYDKFADLDLTQPLGSEIIKDRIARPEVTKVKETAREALLKNYNKFIENFKSENEARIFFLDGILKTIYALEFDTVRLLDSDCQIYLEMYADDIKDTSISLFESIIKIVEMHDSNPTSGSLNACRIIARSIFNLTSNLDESAETDQLRLKKASLAMQSLYDLVSLHNLHM